MNIHYTYLYPKKDDLTSGLVMPIYLDWDTRNKFEANVMLITKIDKDDLVYLMEEFTAAAGTISIYWKRQRWLIQYLDGDQKCKTNKRWIGFFHKQEIT